jgi:ribokinase
MSPSPGVIVLGSINTDLVIRGPRLPRPGQTVLGGRFFQAAGGKGANQAVAAARAGTAAVLFIAAVGDDALGRQALDGLAAENLDTRFVRVVPDQPSGVALILVDEQGENQISVASGANGRLCPADVDAVPDELFRAARVFLCCLESPLETVAHGLRRAKAAGLTTILNPAPADPAICRPDIMRLVDILTPNEGEAAALAADAGGASRPQLLDPSNQQHAAALASARALQSLGCPTVIVTLGAEGCLIVGQDVTHVPGRAVQAIDATAAGDAFNGALAVALAEGRPLPDAARWANRAAAIAVTRAGAQPSLPTREEIEAM